MTSKKKKKKKNKLNKRLQHVVYEIRNRDYGERKGINLAKLLSVFRMRTFHNQIHAGLTRECACGPCAVYHCIVVGCRTVERAFLCEHSFLPSFLLLVAVAAATAEHSDGQAEREINIRHNFGQRRQTRERTMGTQNTIHPPTCSIRLTVCLAHGGTVHVYA